MTIIDDSVWAQVEIIVFSVFLVCSVFLVFVSSRLIVIWSLTDGARLEFAATHSVPESSEPLWSDS